MSGTRRIKIAGEKPEVLEAASGIYEEVLEEILHDCHHNIEKLKCRYCFRGLNQLKQSLCEVRVRAAINRLLAYQSKEIKKQLDSQCDHLISGDDGHGKMWCIKCRKFLSESEL